MNELVAMAVLVGVALLVVVVFTVIESYRQSRLIQRFNEDLRREQEHNAEEWRALQEKARARGRE